MSIFWKLNPSICPLGEVEANKYGNYRTTRVCFPTQQTPKKIIYQYPELDFWKVDFPTYNLPNLITRTPKIAKFFSKIVPYTCDMCEKFQLD